MTRKAALSTALAQFLLIKEDRKRREKSNSRP
jgi:hypothetical protein